MMSKLLFLILFGCSPVHAQTYIKGPALIEGLSSTVTAAGTTTLTVNSQTNQIFTGATTQTVVLPNATTLSLGRYFQIENRSSGIVAVQTSGGGALTSVYPGTQKQVLVTNIGSAAGVWDVSAINVADVTGVLAMINGGTNKAMTASSGAIVYSDADSFELDGTHFNWNATSQQLLLNADGSTYTAAPANTIMHTVGNNGATSRIVFDSHNSGVNGSYLLGRHARGTAAVPSAVINGDTLMGFAGIGYGATGYASNGSGYLLIRASETFTDASNATNMQFFTTPTASITPLQRMYIGSDGHVSLGASAPTTSAKLDIQGTDGALLIPRLTTVQKNALTATAGMTVYDTTLGRFECYRASWTACTQSTPPTVQIFSSGSGTYTTPSGVQYIQIKLVGGGGGGAGSGMSGMGSGGAGGTTSFSTISALGGGGGVSNSGTPATGGTASLGVGPVGYVLAGAAGGLSTYIANNYFGGAAGGNSFFGGGGAGSSGFNAGITAAGNSGSGGGGAGNQAADRIPGNGGAAGGFADAIIVNPSATYSYSVGTAGAAGTAGISGTAGGAGAAGLIIVTEYYQ